MLKELSRATLIIGAVNGQATIAAAGKVFVAIHSLYKKWRLDRVSEPTPDTPVEEIRLEGEASFAEIFAPYIKDEADELCLTQAQIRKLCEENRSSFGVTTFFLFKKGNLLKRFLHWLMKNVFRYEIRKRIFVAVMRPCNMPDGIGIRAEVEHFESAKKEGHCYPYRIVLPLNRPTQPNRSVAI
jgi:hypothetical protein